MAEWSIAPDSKSGKPQGFGGSTPPLSAISIGPPGTGKSHMAQAVGLCAIHAGYQVLYYPVFELLDLIQASPGAKDSAYLWPAAGVF